MAKTYYLKDTTIDYLYMLYRHEVHNMLIYSEISAWLNVEGFKNLSKYYEDWSSEEKEHSELVRKFLNDLNIPLKVGQVDNVELDLNSDSTLQWFAELTVETEDSTTKLYNDLLKMVSDFSEDAMIIPFVHDFLKEQREETNKALNIRDAVKNIGESRVMLQLFDNTFEG